MQQVRQAKSAAQTGGSFRPVHKARFLAPTGSCLETQIQAIADLFQKQRAREWIVEGSSPRVGFAHKEHIPNWSVQTVRTLVPPCNFAVAIISFYPTDATIRMRRLPQLPLSVQYLFNVEGQSSRTKEVRLAFAHHSPTIVSPLLRGIATGVPL